MAASEGIFTNISILGDKEYKKALQDMGRQLTLLKTDMEASQSAFVDQAGSVEALTDKAQALQKIYDTQREKVRLVAEQLNKAKAEYGDNSRQAENLAIALNKAETALNNTKSEIAANERALEDLSTDADDAATNTDKLKAAAETLGGVMGDVAVGGLTVMATAIAGIGTACAAAGGKVLGLGNEYQQALGQLSAQTGATGEELEQLGEIAASIYGDNFGGSLLEVSEALAVTKVNTGLVGDELKKAAENGIMLSDVFGMDFQESSRTAASLMETFGITAQEAYNLIATAAQEGANQNGDLLDVIAEYGPKYEEAGLSAEQMMTSLIAGAENGVYSIDKVGDAVKEFTIRATDGSTTTKEAFESIGLDAEAMSSAIAAGGDEAAAAFEKTLTALNNMEDPLARNQAAVDLFGTQYEDLGAKALPILESMFTDTVAVKDAMTQIGEVKYDNLSDAMEGVKRSIEENLIPVAQTASEELTGMMQDISSSLADGFQAEDLVSIGASIAASLMEGLNGFSAMVAENQDVFAGAMESAVGFMAQALPGLVDTLSGPAAALISGAFGAMEDNAQTIGATAANLVSQLAALLAEQAPLLVTAAGDLVSGFVDGLVQGDSLANMTTSAVELITKLGAALVEAGVTLISKAPEILAQLFEGFKNVDWSGIAADLVNGLGNAITGAITGIQAAITNAFGQVLGWIKGVFGIASPSKETASIGDFLWQGLLSGLEAGVTAACEAVKRIFGQIWDAIRAVFGFGESEESKEGKQAGIDMMTGVADGITSGQGEAENAVRASAQAIVAAFKAELSGSNGDNAWAVEAGGQLIEGIAHGITTALEALNTQVTAAAQGAIDAAAALLTLENGTTIGSTWANAIANGILACVEYITTAADTAANAALTTAANILTEQAGYTIGDTFIYGMENGVYGRTETITAAANTVSSAAHTAADTILSQAAGTTIGENFGGGVATGLGNKNETVATAGTTLASSAENAIAGTKEKFVSVGESLAAGVAKGIENGSSKIEKAARQAAKAAYEAAKAELGIASPSKVMAKVGMQYDEGFAQGIIGGMDKVISSVRSLSAYAAREMAESSRVRPLPAAQADSGKKPAPTIVVHQNIYANDTSYAGQQREAARNMRNLAMSLG